jgi:hypothetical protein
MLRITAEAEAAKSGDRAALHNVQTETNFAARKFYAQRNTYLTGFTLFLSFVLTRTFYITLDLIHAQEEYAKLKASTTGQPGGADAQKTIADLRAQVKALEAKDRDFGTHVPFSQAVVRMICSAPTDTLQTTSRSRRNSRPLSMTVSQPSITKRLVLSQTSGLTRASCPQRLVAETPKVNVALYVTMYCCRF